MIELIELSSPIFSENNLSMHSNHVQVAEAGILTVFKLCAKTFVYSGNDNAFNTVNPILEPTSFNSKNSTIRRSYISF